MNPWLMAGIQLLSYVLIFVCGASAMFFHINRDRGRHRTSRPIDLSPGAITYLEKDEELCFGNEVEGKKPHPDCIVPGIIHGPHAIGTVVSR